MPKNKPLNPSTFDLNDPKARAFINAQKDKYVASRDRSATEANESERSLCTQLMLIDTVLLTVNILALGNADISHSLTLIQRMLMFVGVFLVVGSIVTGIAFYFSIYKFHSRWADAKNTMVDLFGNVDFNTWEEARKRVLQSAAGLPNAVSRVWLRWQVWLLVASFATYLCLILAILFDLRPLTTFLTRLLCS